MMQEWSKFLVHQRLQGRLKSHEEAGLPEIVTQEEIIEKLNEGLL
jgi:fructosamine-3-kinase